MFNDPTRDPPLKGRVKGGVILGQNRIKDSYRYNCDHLICLMLEYWNAGMQTMQAMKSIMT